MDRSERIDSVRASLEAGQGCDASRLILDLPPAERLQILQQAVKANHDDPKAVAFLDFSREVTAPLNPDEKLVWLTIREKATSADGVHRKPSTLIGFSDLTMLPCKNNRSPLF